MVSKSNVRERRNHDVNGVETSGREGTLVKNAQVCHVTSYDQYEPSRVVTDTALTSPQRHAPDDLCACVVRWEGMHPDVNRWN